MDIRRTRHNLNNLCFCNFWVGNRFFWEKYLNLTVPLYNLIRSDEHLRELFLSGKADRKSDIPLFPYFMERMFTTLLASDPTIRACPYYSSDAYPRSEKSLITKVFLTALAPAVESLERKSKVTLPEIQFQNSIGHLFHDWLESDLKHDDAYACMKRPMGLLLKNTLFGHKGMVKDEIMQRVHEINCGSSAATDVFLFGTGSCAEMVLEFLDKQKYVCKGYFDNDRSKWGKLLHGVPITSPCHIPRIKIIVASMHAKKMYKQLRSLGYKKNQIRLLNAAA